MTANARRTLLCVTQFWIFHPNTAMQFRNKSYPRNKKKSSIRHTPRLCMVDASERIYLRLASCNLINCPTKFDESLMVSGLNSMLQRLDASEAVAYSSWMFRYLNAIKFAFQRNLCNLSQTLDTHWEPVYRVDENSTVVAAIDVFYNFFAFINRLIIINKKATSSHLHTAKIYFKSNEILFPRLT